VQEFSERLENPPERIGWREIEPVKFELIPSGNCDRFFSTTNLIFTFLSYADKHLRIEEVQNEITKFTINS
jgi:hypothetical protein